MRTVLTASARDRRGRPGIGRERSSNDGNGRHAPQAAPRSPAVAGEVIACHECGTVHRLPAMPDDTVARCVACGATIFIRFERSVERTLALYLAALALFLVANAFPILTMSIGGQANASTILDGAMALYDDGMWPLALAVGLAGTFCRWPRSSACSRSWCRCSSAAAAVDRGRLSLGRAAPALVDDGGLPAGRDRRLCEAAGPGHGPSRHRHLRLRRHDPAAGRRRCTLRAARDLAPAGPASRPRGAGGAARHHAAGLRAMRSGGSRRFRRTCTACDCPRCGAPLHPRKPDSLERTWALRDRGHALHPGQRAAGA